MKAQKGSPSMICQNEPVDLQNQNKLLLICDLTGNIVFWKGDPKVFETSPSSYLRKNLLSFDFTLLSRLKLASNLNLQLLKKNCRKQFQVEIIRKKAKNLKPPSDRALKLTYSKIQQYFFSQIKVIKIAASVIETNFQKLNKVGDQTQLNTYEKIKRNQPTIKSNQFEKFVMIQAEEITKDKQAYKADFFKDQNIKQIRNKLLDIQFIKEKKIKINIMPEKFESNPQNQVLNNSIEDFDIDILLSSRKKSSAFQPNLDYFNKVSEQKSSEKYQWEQFQGSKKVFQNGEYPLFMRGSGKN